MLIRHFQMRHSLHSMFVSLFDVDVNSVNEAALFDDQIVQFFVNGG